MQGVEVRDAVRPEHDRLAVNDEMILAQLQRGFNDERKLPRPIITAPADQAHAVPIAD